MNQNQKKSPGGWRRCRVVVPNPQSLPRAHVRKGGCLCVHDVGPTRRLTLVENPGTPRPDRAFDQGHPPCIGKGARLFRRRHDADVVERLGRPKHDGRRVRLGPVDEGCHVLVVHSRPWGDYGGYKVGKAAVPLSCRIKLCRATQISSGYPAWKI